MKLTKRNLIKVIKRAYPCQTGALRFERIAKRYKTAEGILRYYDRRLAGFEESGDLEWLRRCVCYITDISPISIADWRRAFERLT